MRKLTKYDVKSLTINNFDTTTFDAIRIVLSVTIGYFLLNGLEGWWWVVLFILLTY